MLYAAPVPNVLLKLIQFFAVCLVIHILAAVLYITDENESTFQLLDIHT